MFRYRPGLVAATLGVVSLLAGSAGAELITFDSLNPTATTYQVVNGQPRVIRDGDLRLLQLAVGGLNIDIFREGGAAFDLIDNSLPGQDGKDPEWGSWIQDPETGEQEYKSVSLDFFADQRNKGVIFSFSETIRSFSLNVGDFGGDVDILKLSAYTGPNATGTLLNPTPVQAGLPKTYTRAWTDTRFYVSSSGGFRSILFRGGFNDFDVFLDRIFFSRSELVPPPDADLDDAFILGDDVIVIPEPASLALLAMGGIFALRRRAV